MTTNPARKPWSVEDVKEIVAETTDIIEKMCIKAALDLTGNNRVAAAELLSLSRQSKPFSNSPPFSCWS